MLFGVILFTSLNHYLGYRPDLQTEKNHAKDFRAVLKLIKIVLYQNVLNGTKFKGFYVVICLMWFFSKMLVVPLIVHSNSNLNPNLLSFSYDIMITYMYKGLQVGVCSFQKLQSFQIGVFYINHF